MELQERESSGWRCCIFSDVDVFICVAQIANKRTKNVA